jgi:hypothetical protein
MSIRLRSVALSLALVLSGAVSALAGGFEVGFNQAWVAEAYGRDFTTGWNALETDLIFARAKAAGAESVRLWLFEGMEKDGAVFDGTRATGTAPGFLEHIEWTCQAARRHGVKIYWTGMNGNWFWPKNTRWSHIHYNVLNDRFGDGFSFRQRVLAPTLAVIARYPDTTFAFDVMNEVEGSVTQWFWSDAWTGARRWIAQEVAFVRARLPGVPVTASAGWDTATDDILSGKLSGLGLDFFDVHLYNDQGAIPKALPMRMFGWRTGKPVLLGEYGQAAQRYDDALQSRVTGAFLNNAKSLGWMGAFAWRMDDERPATPTWVPYHSYFKDDRERPAVGVIREFARRNP